jgi:hypothetical protein
MKRYPIVNFKNPAIYFFFLLLLLVSAFYLYAIGKLDDYLLDKLFFIPVLMSLIFLVYAVTGVVEVSFTAVKKKTIFGTRTIRIDEIKLFGVMRQEGRLGIRIIEEEAELETVDWLFPKTIFISTDKDFNPMSFKKQPVIRFHYQKNVYRDILGKVKKR